MMNQDFATSILHSPSSVVAIKHQELSLSSNGFGLCNAAGYHLPPLLIFKRKTLPMSVLDNEIPGSMYCLSDSGWMDGETFDNWFSKHFPVHLVGVAITHSLLQRQVKKESLFFFCLPLNTTHLLQPLDKGIFGPLTYWNEEYHLYLRSNPYDMISDDTLNCVFSRAWGRAMTIPNAMAAFRTTGVHPFDRLAVTTLDMPDRFGESSRLHYIPINWG